MNNQIVKSQAFDFSRYQHGDKILISDSDVLAMGFKGYQALWAALGAACAKHGLTYTCSRNDVDQLFEVEVLELSAFAG